MKKMGMIGAMVLILWAFLVLILGASDSVVSAGDPYYVQKSTIEQYVKTLYTDTPQCHYACSKLIDTAQVEHFQLLSIREEPMRPHAYGALQDKFANLEQAMDFEITCDVRYRGEQHADGVRTFTVTLIKKRGQEGWLLENIESEQTEL